MVRLSELFPGTPVFASLAGADRATAMELAVALDEVRIMRSTMAIEGAHG